MPKKWKSAIIVGGGAMAVNQHLMRLFGILGCEHVAIYDRDSNRQEFLARKFSSNKQIRILNAIPETDKYSIALITTPPKFHLPLFEQMIDASNHFLIEKPLALNEGEAQTLTRLAAEKQKTVYVGLIRRTLQSFVLVGEIVRSGRYGALRSANMSEGGIFNWKAVSIGSFSRELNGGGVLMDTGPHCIDLLLQVFNRLTISACTVDSPPTAIEANCRIDFEADNKVPVRLELSRNRVLSNLARFEFDEATLWVGVCSESIKVVEQNGLTYYLCGPDNRPDPNYNELVDNFHRTFLLHGDNRGINPETSTIIASLIDDAYSVAQFVEPEF